MHDDTALAHRTYDRVGAHVDILGQDEYRHHAGNGESGQKS